MALCVCMYIYIYACMYVCVCVYVYVYVHVWMGARFSAPVQTGTGAQPASYTMGAGYFPGVERPGRGVDHPPHITPRLKKE
jgi:hypothetical protein